MARSLGATTFSDFRVIDDDDQNNHEQTDETGNNAISPGELRQSFNDDKSDVGRASLWRLLATIFLSPLLINKKIS